MRVKKIRMWVSGDIVGDSEVVNKESRLNKEVRIVKNNAASLVSGGSNTNASLPHFHIKKSSKRYDVNESRW